MNDFPIEWWYFFLLFLPVMAYAEIHFRYPFVPSRLFKREPEILFDLPHRGQQGEKVPLILLIKDAHRFPVQVADLQVNVMNLKKQELSILNFPLDTEITEKFYSKIILLEPTNFPQAGEYQLSAKLSYYDPAKNKRTIVQDNYQGIPHSPFQIFISRDPLPTLNNWHWGDLHVHSNYTDDQVEFGAPIEATVLAAKSIGLDFIAITDHSYDLDDDPDNCLVNRPDIPKWNSFQHNVRRLQNEHKDFVIIPGEEVSVGNHRHQNVHCQILNDPQFHPGSGDSAERLFRHRPTMMLKELLKKKARNALSIAAHPQEVPPFSQRLILGRGSWDEQDCMNNHLDALQILNNKSDRSLSRGLELWKQLLLNGRKIGIVAGNDAHGNFNCFRQITIPFLKMIYSRKHLFGQVRTAVKCKNLNTPLIMEAIREKRAIVSNGPLAIMEVKGSQTVFRLIHSPAC
jgi:hypothetical protein